MQVVLIGAGNIATVIGKILFQKGFSIRQVYSRNIDHAKELAQLLNADAINNLKFLQSNANFYIVAVPDNSLTTVLQQIHLEDEIVIHTAGSVSKNTLQVLSSRYGVLWPMKMIRKDMQTLEPVRIFIDGNSEETISEIKKLALALSSSVSVANDETRLKLHLLATITSNFSNHLYHLAAEYCEKEGIDFSLVYPIIQETAIQIQLNNPSKLQAGPAFRADTETMQKHLSLLNDNKQLLKIYEALSESIHQTFFHPRDSL